MCFGKTKAKTGGLLFYVDEDSKRKIDDVYNFPTKIKILLLELAFKNKKAGHFRFV